MAAKKYLDYDGLKVLVSGITEKFDAQTSALTQAIEELDSSAAVGLDDNGSSQQVITGIEITDGKLSGVSGATLECNDILLDQDITVLGVNVGDLANGDKLASGTSITDILKAILIQVKERALVNPKTTLTGGSNQTLEVGSAYSNTFGHTYTDGAFTGTTADGFSPTSIAAGCAEGTTTYYASGSTSAATATISNETGEIAFTVQEGTIRVGCSTAYGASTSANIRNNGTTSSNAIAAGTAVSSTVNTVTGQFKYYMGYTTAVSAETINTTALIQALKVRTGNCTVNGTTTILNASTELTSDGTSIAIAIPAKYSLKTIQNGLGVDITPNFTSTATVEYTNGTVTTNYKIYLYPITSGAQVAYKNVTIGL